MINIYIMDTPTYSSSLVISSLESSIMLGLLQLSLLATTFTLVAGNCSVRSVQQKDTIKRCRQVRECIKEAFYSNENNLYVIDSVFMSTETRLPVELIIEYEVTMNRTTHEKEATNNTGSGSGLISGLGSGSGSGYTEDDRAIGDGNLTSVTYTEEIGWSTNGIHKGIRSKVIVLLQPALLWWTMSWAIGAYGFPETIQFEVNLTECHQVENITKGEVKEALEYLTTNVRSITVIINPRRMCARITVVCFFFRLSTCTLEDALLLRRSPKRAYS